MARKNDKSLWIPVPPPALAVLDCSAWRRPERERRYWQFGVPHGLAALRGRGRPGARR